MFQIKPVFCYNCNNIKLIKWIIYVWKDANKSFVPCLKEKIDEIGFFPQRKILCSVKFKYII